MKKASNTALRCLCGTVDFIIILAPIQFIMMGVFRVSTGQADLLFKLLFAVYGALTTEYWGKTVGKYFGKLRVIDNSGGKPVMLYLGLRELTKSLYFIPYIGTVFLGLSIGMMLIRRDGRTLHDLVGNTKVVYAWQVKEGEKNADR